MDQTKTKKQIHTVTHLISPSRFVDLLRLFVQNSSYDAVALYILRPGSFEQLVCSEGFSSQISDTEAAFDLAWGSFDSGASREVLDKEVIDILFGTSHAWAQVTFLTSVWNKDLREGFTIVAYAKVPIEVQTETFGVLEFSRLLKLEFDHAALRIECTQAHQNSDILSHEQRRKEAAIEALQEGFVEQDATGKIISWNTSALEILHMSEDQIRGKTSDDPVWGSIREDGSPFSGKDHPGMVALKTKRPVRGVIMGLVNPELSTDVRWIKINAHPYEVSGEWYVTALFSDVTQDVNLQRDLKQSESRWNLALESAHQGVWDWDISQGKLFTSDQWKRLLGYAPNEVGDGLEEWSSRVHDEDRDRALELLQEVLDGNKSTYEAHYRMITKNGEIRYHFDRGAVVERDKDGNPTRMIGTNTDESDIVEQKIEVERVSEYLQTLIDSLPFSALVLDENRVIRFQNEHVCSLLEISGGELSGSALEKFFPDPIVRNEFLQKYQSLASGWHDFRIQKSNGEKLITSWRFLRFKENSVLILVQNVTEERAQSLLLRKMNYALDQTKDGVIMTDLEGKAVYVNDSSQEMFGYDPVSDEFLGHHVTELDANPEDIPEGFLRSEQIIQELQKNHTWSGKMYQKKKDGSLVLTYVTATLMVDENDQPIGMIGTLRDISEEENLRQALEENRLQLAAIVENLPVGVFTVDSEGLLETQNVIVRELFRDNAPEVLASKSLDDLFGGLKMYGAGHAELSLEDLPPYQSIQTGTVVQNRDIEIVNSHTNQVVFMNVVAAPLISDSGENHGAVCMIEDITELKQIEDAKTEFVSMASHQLRTPLTSLKWNLELFEDSDLSCLKTPQIEFIDEIHGSTYRMIGLVNSLLNVSRVEMGTFAIHSSDVSLQKTIQQVIDQFKEVLRNRSISVRDEYENVPEVYQIDPVVFEVILENLVSNAIKYTHDGTRIDVRVYSGDESDFSAKGVFGKSLILEVADQGIGIPEEEQSKIFQRLFRASNAVTANTIGTGIGLYMVQKIVRDIGGIIWFETEHEKGTRFFVALPWEGVQSREGEKVLEKHSVQE